MGLRMNVFYANTTDISSVNLMLWLNKYIVDHNFIFRSKLDRRFSQI